MAGSSSDNNIDQDLSSEVTNPPKEPLESLMEQETTASERRLERTASEETDGKNKQDISLFIIRLVFLYSQISQKI